MKSDYVLDSAQFSPHNASKGAEIACAFLRKGDEENKDSLGDMERMRARPGKTVLEGENIEIQSRDSGRTIPCRVVLPKAGRTSVTGVFLHFHGEAFVKAATTKSILFCIDLPMPLDAPLFLLAIDSLQRTHIPATYTTALMLQIMFLKMQPNVLEVLCNLLGESLPVVTLLCRPSFIWREPMRTGIP
uniref:Uncharacterized protein n=1 Tax=Bionectria ochroleuca TaxID=29856 RepID=A0A8H7N6A8_BIOOC